MKIAVSCQGQDLNSAVDPRFGRAAGFMICDTDSGEATYLSNGGNLNLPQGAGLQTAQSVAQSGAKAVISGHVGPKAFMALAKGRIAVHLVTDAGLTVAQAVQLFKDGKLPEAKDANTAGHW